MKKYEYNEKEVIIKGEYALSGTLAIPESDQEKLPAMLLIAGSGQIDKDGYVESMKFHTNLYKDLAHLVTSLGFISLRVDKRGTGKSEGIFFKTGMWDLIKDIEQNIKFLKNLPNVDCEKIILLGHSEGCILAPAVNSRIPVDGCVLLSGAAETLDEALKRQREILVEEAKNKSKLNGFLLRLLKADKKIEKQAKKQMDKIMSTDKDVMKSQFKKVNAKWFKEHYQYNVLQDLKKIQCPVLALTGDKDFQADSKKLQRLPELVVGELDFHVIRNMNHGLKMHEGPMSALNFQKEYKEKANDPLHLEVVDILSSWLNKHYPLSNQK